MLTWQLSMASFSNLAASGSGLSPSPAAKEILATSQELERRSSFKSTSSPFTALLAISGAFASIALIPYLLTRRHISKLELQVRSLQEIAVKQRQEWKHDILRSRLQHAHSVRVMTKYRTLEHKMNVLQRVHSRHYRSIVKLGDTTRSQMNALTAEIMDIKKYILRLLVASLN